MPDEANPPYPIRITKPAEVVSKLLPVMQVGLHAASLVNGVAGVVHLFGSGVLVARGLQKLGGDSQAGEFRGEVCAVHEKVQEGDGDGDASGGALRDLAAFFAEKDRDGAYAGLRRIGDEDGTAVWTLLTDPEEVKAAIEERAAQRRAEARRRREIPGADG